MRYQFIISAFAQEDLTRCRERDSYAASKISTVLREVVGGQRASDALIDPRFYDEAVDNVDYLWILQDRRVNGYRVRLVDVLAWRLIIVADHLEKRVGLFGVMPRDDDYPPALADRVEKESDEYGFPRIGGR